MVALAATSRAEVTLRTTATATVSERALVRLEVANAGDVSAANVTPEVVYQGRQVHGEPLAELRPGDRHAWTFDLPLPTEPGTAPAVIQVRYTDSTGHRTSVPAVATVVTPGLLAVLEARATLTTTPVARFGEATVTIENPTPVPIHGRLITVLPAGLTTEPESQPAEVPAQGSREFPIVVQNDGAARGSTGSMFALFEYNLDGRWHLIVAPAGVTISTASAAQSPLLVGAIALGLALALLAVAWRRAARRVANARNGPPGRTRAT
jgi:hypothetical protein